MQQWRWMGSQSERAGAGVAHLQQYGIPSTERCFCCRPAVSWSPLWRRTSPLLRPRPDCSLGTTINPAKLKKKLRKHRLATSKGVVKGQAKKANPLAGANQFHKKHKKKR